MYPERKNGLAYSAAFHLLLLLFMIFGLPSFFRSEPPPEPAAITVELLPISELSNVKPSDGNQSEKPKPEEPKEEEQKKPSPPVKTSEPTPPKVEPEPAPVVKPEPKPEIKKEEKKPEPKPEPKPEQKPEPKKEEKKPKKDDSLDAILKAVKETAQKEKTDKKEPVKEDTSSSKKAISNRFDPSQQMSISEKDAIMAQLAQCWNPPAGAKNAHELVVVIDAEFNSDGSYIRADIASESRSRYNSDTFFRAAADAALRAVKQCSPLKNLSTEKYETWKSMELHFDPRQMLQ